MISKGVEIYDITLVSNVIKYNYNYFHLCLNA